MPTWDDMANTVLDKTDALCKITWNGKKLANTTVRKDGDDFVVRFYRTDILRYRINGEVVINLDGHTQSATTKRRLKQLLEPHLSPWSKKFVLYIGEHKYEEGMVLQNETVNTVTMLRRAAFYGDELSMRAYHDYCEEYGKQ